jgi:hypothetical protein
LAQRLTKRAVVDGGVATVKGWQHRQLGKLLQHSGDLLDLLMRTNSRRRELVTDLGSGVVGEVGKWSQGPALSRHTARGLVETVCPAETVGP